MTDEIYLMNTTMVLGMLLVVLCGIWFTSLIIATCDISLWLWGTHPFLGVLFGCGVFTLAFEQVILGVGILNYHGVSDWLLYPEGASE